MDLRQFKLTNDEEIICEVVQWNDEEHDTIVVRKALKIIAFDDMETSMRYFTFKPWMLMNTDPSALHVLNSYHIVSEATPSPTAQEYFKDIIAEMSESEDLELLYKDSDNRLEMPIDKDLLH
jgi:hypothetical protein